MKTIWGVIAIVSFANLMAMGAVVGWLLNTGRLDAERATAIRSMLSETVAEQRERERLEDEAAAAAEAEEEEKRRLLAPVVTANEAASVRIEASEVDRQRIERLRAELDALKAGLASERRLLDEDRAAFEAERSAFEALRARIAAENGDEQFQKSLGVIEGMRPAEAARLINELITGGSRQEALGYLDAMRKTGRTKILSEIGKTDPTLAAGLLEEIRLRGVVSSGP